MKRLLPILTLALLGAAVTASADNFYYGYYKDPGQSGTSNEYWLRNNNVYLRWDPVAQDIYGYANIYETQTDTFTYKNFSVTRDSNWKRIGNEIDNTPGQALINNSNFYRIQVVGNDVELYLTDYVDNAGDKDYNENALYNNITEYGYRELKEGTIEGRSLTPTEIVTSTDTDVLSTKYVASGVTVKNTLTVVDNTPMVTYADKTTPEKLPTIDTVDNQGKTIERYQYYLGTFQDGDIIEVYVKDNNGGEAYSYSGINEIDSADRPVGAEGAFGDGGYRLNLQTDKMVNNFYYQDENLGALGYTEFLDPDIENPTEEQKEAAERKREAASSKSMPLSALDPSGSRVFFGIIAKVDGVIYSPFTNGGGGSGGAGAAGSPLPGGLQMALIAGLFGLGFCYVRRRKAIAD